ncbi:MAG: cell division protein FtsQ/DivIB [Burkholderiales bacterium]|nr:cell division protein FtsQ/DivIB [Burkholderiales bacterium]
MANALPADIRLMNATAALVGVLALGVLALGAASWVARQPAFALRQIRLEGDTARNNAATVRAHVMSRLAGNFFTLNLQAAREAFEAVPWVRHAVVRKVWPNRLVVQLEEHRPVALWKGEEGDDRLVNSHGEVFEANLGDVDEAQLPDFAGPLSEAPAILAMYRRLRPAFEPLGREPVSLSLSGRGSWRVELDDGVAVELGRGSEDEVLERTARFVRTITQVGGTSRRPIDYADLRHADGYAVRFKGGPVAAASATGAH